jgi:hypothetical protein
MASGSVRKPEACVRRGGATPVFGNIAVARGVWNLFCIQIQERILLNGVGTGGDHGKHGE